MNQQELIEGLRYENNLLRRRLNEEKQKASFSTPRTGTEPGKYGEFDAIVRKACELKAADPTIRSFSEAVARVEGGMSSEDTETNNLHQKILNHSELKNVSYLQSMQELGVTSY